MMYVICGSILIGLGIAVVVNTALTIRESRNKEQTINVCEMETN